MNRSFFTAEKVNEHVRAIYSGCGEIMYLIEGNDRAVLMDTNLGVRGLRALVDSLTDKPYDVVLTHGHIDHAMGVPEFVDHRVYMNHKDISIYQGMSALEGRKGYIGLMMREYALEDKDFLTENPNFPFQNLMDGQNFDLGGITIIVYAVPGHTPGSMVLYLPELRTLIAGDACNNSTFLFDPASATVAEYQKNIRRLNQLLKGKIEHVWLCHHIREAAPDILDQMDELCDNILKGNTDDEPFYFMGHTAYAAKAHNDRMERLDGKFANLIYSKDRIR